MKQKIVPHLWYDKEAKEAAEFYVSVFSAEGGQTDSKITNITTLRRSKSLLAKLWRRL
jgi:predicted 3-demethylubiquinone-9 3-methyltransferase (glyoxalase superfamily)